MALVVEAQTYLYIWFSTSFHPLHPSKSDGAMVNRNLKNLVFSKIVVKEFPNDVMSISVM